MNAHYDNHANDIEYFDLHKPKIEVKRKSNFVDINDLSDSQVVEKLEEVEIRLGELTELYNSTKHEGTFTILSKLHGFKSVIRANMRKRKLETNESLRLKIIALEKQLSEIGLGEGSKDQEKKINHLNLVNENLKNEIKALKLNDNLQELYDCRAKAQRLIVELSQVRSALAENREAEKTKRYQISENQSLRVLREFKKLVNAEIGSDVCIGLIQKASEIAENQE